LYIQIDISDISIVKLDIRRSHMRVTYNYWLQWWLHKVRLLA
jgi:hypothetical protein